MSKIVIEMEKTNDLHCGLGQVAYHLGKNFEKKNNRLYYYMPEEKFNLFPSHKYFLPVKKLHRKVKFTAPRADLWHCLHQDSEFFPRNKNAKIVLTIHDLNFLYENISESTKRKKLEKLQRKIDQANALTFVSHFTQAEVEKHLNTNGKIKKVIYNGLALDPTLKSVRPHSVLENEKFLFSIGTVVAKKNFHVLIDFIEKIDGYKIVLAGWKDNHYAQEMQLKILEKNLEDRFIMIGKINEYEKKWLYENCEAFLFPSLQEGFGLPVIEAMANGKPTFISNLTSLPEIGGDDAFYFKNFKPQDMVSVFQEGMMKFQADSTMEERLKERAKQYSWLHAVEEYLNLYQELLTT